MTTQPPDSTPPPTPGGHPIKPSEGAPKPMPEKDAFLLKSPFAKMFAATGTEPTAKEMRMIINSILKYQVDQIKKQDAAWKKAMKKLKDAIEGKD